MPEICNSDTSQLDEFKCSNNGLAARAEESSVSAILLWLMSRCFNLDKLLNALRMLVICDSDNSQLDN